MKGQIFQRSIRRATPKGTGKKNRQKSLPVPSPGALFRSRARFLSILGSRPDPKIDPKPVPRLGFLNFGDTFFDFLVLPSLGRVPRPLPEAPGTIPDQLLRGFRDTFLLVLSGSCRDLSGSAGMLPGSAPNLCNLLAGVPLGYGDLAQRFKFAVPQRGPGVLNPVRSPTGPGGVSPPYLPAGPGEPAKLDVGNGCFPHFFRFFRCFQKRSKNGRSKN